MSFLTTITRSPSLRTFPLTRGPSYLAAFHTSSSRMTPETDKKPAGQQSQQELRQKMAEHQKWNEEVASSSESIVKADRGEITGAEEVQMEEKMYRRKKARETEKKAEPRAS